jgi:CRP-like cAMP-binding protein
LALPSATQAQNRLLQGLADKELSSVSAHLQPIQLELKRELYRSGDHIEYVYFVAQGVVSIVKDLDDGNVVEVAIVGPEGFIGVPVLLGSLISPYRSLMQVPGNGYRIKARAFGDLLDQAPGLRAITLRYILALINQMAQTAACNRMHDVEARCARWLLMTHDRVTASTFPLTHEFLAQMLGVHRPTVSLAAQTLQRAGLIQYVRGVVTIVDREGLEAVSCGCYEAIRKEYEKMA